MYLTKINSIATCTFLLTVFLRSGETAHVSYRTILDEIYTKVLKFFSRKESTSADLAEGQPRNGLLDTTSYPFAELVFHILALFKDLKIILTGNRNSFRSGYKAPKDPTMFYRRNPELPHSEVEKTIPKTFQGAETDAKNRSLDITSNLLARSLSNVSLSQKENLFLNRSTDQISLPHSDLNTTIPKTLQVAEAKSIRKKRSANWIPQVMNPDCGDNFAEEDHRSDEKRNSKLKFPSPYYNIFLLAPDLAKRIPYRSAVDYNKIFFDYANCIFPTHWPFCDVILNRRSSFQKRKKEVSPKLYRNGFFLLSKDQKYRSPAKPRNSINTYRSLAKPRNPIATYKYLAKSRNPIAKSLFYASLLRKDRVLPEKIFCQIEGEIDEKNTKNSVAQGSTDHRGAEADKKNRALETISNPLPKVPIDASLLQNNKTIISNKTKTEEPSKDSFVNGSALNITIPKKLQVAEADKKNRALEIISNPLAKLPVDASLLQNNKTVISNKTKNEELSKDSFVSGSAVNTSIPKILQGAEADEKSRSIEAISNPLAKLSIDASFLQKNKTIISGKTKNEEPSKTSFVNGSANNTTIPKTLQGAEANEKSRSLEINSNPRAELPFDASLLHENKTTISNKTKNEETLKDSFVNASALNTGIPKTLQGAEADKKSRSLEAISIPLSKLSFDASLLQKNKTTISNKTKNEELSKDSFVIGSFVNTTLPKTLQGDSDSLGRSSTSVNTTASLELDAKTSSLAQKFKNAEVNATATEELNEKEHSLPQKVDKAAEPVTPDSIGKQKKVTEAT